MSSYENVVGGKLKLKGKALDVKSGSGLKKKKKQKKLLHDQKSLISEDELVSAGGNTEVEIDGEDEEDMKEGNRLGDGEKGSSYDHHLTAAEKRYIEQRERIDNQKLKKTANKSHRDRIQDFNQYLANMSEHYDIPKVGPG